MLRFSSTQGDELEYNLEQKRPAGPLRSIPIPFEAQWLCGRDAFGALQHLDRWECWKSADWPFGGTRKPSSPPPKWVPEKKPPPKRPERTKTDLLTNWEHLPSSRHPWGVPVTVLRRWLQVDLSTEEKPGEREPLVYPCLVENRFDSFLHVWSLPNWISIFLGAEADISIRSLVSPSFFQNETSP